MSGCVAPKPVVPVVCTGGFDASFIQLNQLNLQNDPSAWQRELDVLRSTGVRTLVLQYSGDADGSYDLRTAGQTPVRSLLAAAQEVGMDVFLGLYADPNWPQPIAAASAKLPAPLNDPAQTDWLSELCRSFKSCSGWYIPHEIDEHTWATPAGAEYISRFLRITTARLRELRPSLPIAIAPFYAETLPTATYSAWWDKVLAKRSIDMLMLQDGAGARGTSMATIRRMLRDLRSVLDRHHVELWSVVETFRQISGTPINDAPFVAIPADYARVREQLHAERPLVRRMVAFSVLDYMHPERGGRHKALYDQYLARCRH
jgi:hypothetical protein